MHMVFRWLQMRFSLSKVYSAHISLMFEYLELNNIPFGKLVYRSSVTLAHFPIVGEPKSRIVQKHTFFAPERYTVGILYTDSLNSA